MFYCGAAKFLFTYASRLNTDTNKKSASPLDPTVNFRHPDRPIFPLIPGPISAHVPLVTDISDVARK